MSAYCRPLGVEDCFAVGEAIYNDRGCIPLTLPRPSSPGFVRTRSYTIHRITLTLLLKVSQNVVEGEARRGKGVTHRQAPSIRSQQYKGLVPSPSRSLFNTSLYIHLFLLSENALLSLILPILSSSASTLFLLFLLTSDSKLKPYTP